MIEMLCDYSDELAELYLEGREIKPFHLYSVVRNLCLSRKIVPVLCGSAFKNKGIQQLLDGVCNYLPSPLDRGIVSGFDPKDTNKVKARHPEIDEPFSGLIFKIANDPYVGSLAFVEIYSGELKQGSQVLNTNNVEKQRVQKIMQLHADKKVELVSAVAGDIVALAGLKNVVTGQTICDPRNTILFDMLDYPEPVISMAVEPKTSIDEKKLNSALKHLAFEDPSLTIDKNDETGQILIKGMGELHLEVVVDRLQREHKVGVNIGQPQVSYRESISGSFEKKI